MKDKILLWNDDNHDPLVYINNKFMGVDFDTVLESVLYTKPISDKCEILTLYCWDLDDAEYENDGDQDIIFDWFQSMPNISEEQWDYIFKSDWVSLGKTL